MRPAQAHYRDYNQMTYARSVLVIHNMAHQGRGPMADLGNLQVPGHYKEHFRLYDPIGGEHMNIMKAGLLTAHRLVAVSHGWGPAAWWKLLLLPMCLLHGLVEIGCCCMLSLGQLVTPRAAGLWGWPPQCGSPPLAAACARYCFSPQLLHAAMQCPATASTQTSD